MVIIIISILHSNNVSITIYYNQAHSNTIKAAVDRHIKCSNHSRNTGQKFVRVCSDSNPPKSDKLTAITAG